MTISCQMLPDTTGDRRISGFKPAQMSTADLEGTNGNTVASETKDSSSANRKMECESRAFAADAKARLLHSLLTICVDGPPQNESLNKLGPSSLFVHNHQGNAPGLIHPMILALKGRDIRGFLMQRFRLNVKPFHGCQYMLLKIEYNCLLPLCPDSK